MQTLIAAFNDSNRAQQAIDALVAQGFDRGSVHLQSGYDADTTLDHGAVQPESAHDHRQPGYLEKVEHFFSNLFSDDDSTNGHADRYVDVVRRGNSVVAVDASTDAELDQATSLLYDLGAVNVDEESDGTTGSDALLGQSVASTSSLQSSGGQVVDGEGQVVMPIVEEEIQVGKRVVQNGGIRVVKRITETPVSEMVTLRDERAVVERRPVSRAATEADFTAFKEGTIEVREQSEEAVVGKTAHVVEEVVVGKQVTEHTEAVSDTVRRTDVEVERLDAETRMRASDVKTVG